MRIFVFISVCCLLLCGDFAFSQYPWCADRDNVTAEVIGGALVLDHNLATYNCCPDSFTYTAETDGWTLLVTEYEILTMGCSCMCCYNLGATITGLAPGRWTVIYRWLDNDTWTWREQELTVLMEEAGKSDLVLEGSLDSSGCLELGNTPDPSTGGMSLAQNQPNPFNPTTTIRFEAPAQVAVHLTVFDFSGRLVRTLLRGETARPGWNEVVWNGRDEAGRQLASGTYFYRLEAEGFNRTRSMVLLR